jgi:hypothetical protein
MCQLGYFRNLFILIHYFYKNEIHLLKRNYFYPPHTILWVCNIATIFCR